MGDKLINQRPSLRRVRPVATADLVRLGWNQDGGYLANQVALTWSRFLLTAGINDDWSFEEDFARHLPGALIEAFDGSVSAGNFVREAGDHFVRAGRSLLRLEVDALGDELRETSHYLERGVSFRRFFGRRGRSFHQAFLGGLTQPGWYGIGECLVRLRSQRPDSSGPEIFVKLDIEGAEYGLVASLAEHAAAITQVVVEWHDLNTRWSAFEEAIAQLLPSFVVAHVHGNNHAPLIGGTGVPAVLEMTLLNRSLWKSAETARPLKYPTSLDRPCKPGREDYSLAFD